MEPMTNEQVQAMRDREAAARARWERQDKDHERQMFVDAAAIAFFAQASYADNEPANKNIAKVVISGAESLWDERERRRIEREKETK